MSPVLPQGDPGTRGSSRDDENRFLPGLECKAIRGPARDVRVAVSSFSMFGDYHEKVSLTLFD